MYMGIRAVVQECPNSYTYKSNLLHFLPFFLFPPSPHPPPPPPSSPLPPPHTHTDNTRFHGYGTLYFTNGGKFEAEWESGRAVGPASGGQYSFRDGLQYQDDDWRYCDGIDRRFWSEVCQEIKPAGILL